MSLYCLSNPLYPGIYKVGYSARDVSERADELYTTGVPLPFKIEFAKEVGDYKGKERILHRILERYGKRVSPGREFFQIPLEEIRDLFELLDGPWYSSEGLPEIPEIPE